jgi:hypothetical protein
MTTEMRKPIVCGVFVDYASVGNDDHKLLIGENGWGPYGLCDPGSEIAHEAAPPQHWSHGFYARLREVLAANRGYILGEEGAKLFAETETDRAVADEAGRHGYGD